MANRSQSEVLDEVTPLLPRDDQKSSTPPTTLLWRLLLCGFLVSASFGVTQVAMLYVFKEMVCNAYYGKDHLNPSKDQCKLASIEARAAREIAILAASTMFFGLVNLLVAGWCIKRFGVKWALFIQVFWPAARLAIQNVGVEVGGNVGIIIVQSSQIITVLGGPSGYVLALNTFITEVVSIEARTGALGQLMGFMMYGVAIGFLAGGLIADAFGVAAPYRITLLLFVLCCVYIATVLPSIEIEKDDKATSNEKSTGILRFFGPLRIFAPQKWILPSGRTSLHFGSLTLAIGVFLGILATGYIGMLMMLYSESDFGFSSAANAWLLFIYTMLRGAYLAMVFPRIITRGRKWTQPAPTAISENEPPPPLREDIQPSPIAAEIVATDAMDAETEPLIVPPREKEEETFVFDLYYARGSLIADAILSGLIVFVTKGWQLYIIATILPLSAGTGSASKGVLLQLTPKSQKVDALSGITLVENVARLLTTALFGMIFAALAEVGRTHLVFIANGGVALVGFVVLLFCRFPPAGSRRFIE